MSSQQNIEMRHILMEQIVFLFFSILEALFHLIRIFKIFFFFALIMGALIWYRGKAGLMYIAVWESQRPSPLALQKECNDFCSAMCALRGFAKRERVPNNNATQAESPL